jgi:AraC-like DNA-binding protein
MLMDGMDAASAAFEVGYKSASQFSREYNRLFGQEGYSDSPLARALPVVSINNRQSAS